MSNLRDKDEHAIARQTARRFFTAECAPHQTGWMADRSAPREVWLAAGELGLLAPTVEEVYGGIGADPLWRFIVAEEQARAGVMLPAVSSHNIAVELYVAKYATGPQKKAHLPSFVSGERICVAARRGGAEAPPCRFTWDGERYRMSGQIILDQPHAQADLILFGARPAASATGEASLFLLDPDGLEGCRRVPAIEQFGYPGPSRTRYVLESAAMPAESLLGGVEGEGDRQIAEANVESLLITALEAVVCVETALEATIEYVKGRRAFGQRIIDFQNSRFVLARAKTEAVILRAWIEDAIEEFAAGRLDYEAAAALKWWAADRLTGIVDNCVQLHGGYGYILDYPIARLWVRTRTARSDNGSNEAMKHAIADRLFASLGAHAAGDVAP